MKETKRMSAAQRRARQRKQRNRRIAMTVALVLVVALASIGGTIAWLTDKTDPVENTFTVGDINITLAETTTDYKMVPGNTIAKDPKVTVKAKLTHVDGTSIDLLRSQKKRLNTCTGVTGVYMKKDKFAVRITFQGKVYYLGRYEKLETAKEVRKQAEETVHREAVRFYERWKKRADAEPIWAEKHPISFHVEKTGTGDLKMEILPKMDD